MLRSLTRYTLTGLVVFTLVAAGCGDDDDDTASTDATGAPTTEASGSGADAAGDVLEVAAAEGDLGMFLEATEAAGIMDGLHGTGPFTVFVPTDEAFEAYLSDAGMTQTEVFADAGTLQRLVEHHIVAMSEDAEMVMAMDGQSFTTEAGTPLEVTVDGETVMVGDATVERYDIQASNGVIHVIDAVLIPPAA
jgi:transforming growth factor-beta-induced protein